MSLFYCTETSTYLQLPLAVFCEPDSGPQYRDTYRTWGPGDSDTATFGLLRHENMQLLGSPAKLGQDSVVIFSPKHYNS